MKIDLSKVYDMVSWEFLEALTGRIWISRKIYLVDNGLRIHSKV